MSKNLDSPTKLTEFAPLSPEESSVGVGFLFSRLFKRGTSRESRLEASTSSSDTIQNEQELSSPAASEESCKTRDDLSVPSSARDSSPSLHPTNLPFTIYADMGDGRSLPNVLKRISNLLAMKSSGLQAYKDTDFKQYWMPDSVSKECYDCGDRFTTFRRRHHCRVCGQIFCSRCCNQEIPGTIMGCTGDLRVCTYCCKVVLSYLQSEDFEALSKDLKAVQENLQSKYGESSSGTVPSVQPGGTAAPPCNTLQSPAAGRDRSTGLTRTMSRRKQSYQEDRFALGRSGNLASSNSYLTSDNLELTAEDHWKSLQGSCLRDIWECMKKSDTGISMQTYRYQRRSFPACFLGTQLVDWLIQNNQAATINQGLNLGQALINEGYVECVSNLESLSLDGRALYRLCSQPAVSRMSTPPSSPTAASVSHDNLRSKQLDESDYASKDSEADADVKEHDTVILPSSGSTFYLDLDVQENRVHLRRPRQPSEQPTASHSPELEQSAEEAMNPDLNNTGISREFLKDTLLVEGSETRELVPTMGWHLVKNLRTDNGEKEAYIRFSEAFEQHERCLLQQLLSAEGLSQSWAESVMPLIHQVVDLVRPDVKNDADDMDVRQYVQFKKVSGGARSESCVINGVVCTKNVAHRSMATRLSNPRILLLGCSIIYERVEGRFLSLEPLMLQEHDYLKNAVARIVSLRPDLVLVERTVSRLAQDLLLEQGITLVLNVKPAVLERLARLTQADILTCVDAHVGKPRLGMCHNFFLRKFHLDNTACNTKTLMFFDGCATHLGCTIILRGGACDELRRLKKVISHMILVNYSWKLEKSFLMDEFAMPPSVPNDIFFADEELKEPKESDKDRNSESHPVVSKSCPDGSIVAKLSDGKEKHKMQSRTASKEKGLCGVEDKKTEAVVDQSDPLHQYLAGENQAAGEDAEQLSVATLPLANRFRKALDGTVLSSSPYLQYSVPFLETEAGRQCALRRYFPEQVFCSPQLAACSSTFTEVPSLGRSEESTNRSAMDGVFVRPYHPFVHARLTKCVESWEVQALLASFRAVGSRLQHPEETTRPSCLPPAQSSPVLEGQPHWPQLPVTDALNPMNHQRLTVLFCSFSPESANAPAFCVNPWVVNMELYGRNDIPLGQFLQHYCFRKSYKCPSLRCNTPMQRHIRRFVHDGCCIQVTLKELDSHIPVEGNAILMWSWCSICKLVSPVVPMSLDTWSLSFAKYLELRFHGHMFTRRGKGPLCCHSLHHDHYQYFGFHDIVAAFKLSTIAMWEISLPPSQLLNGRGQAQAQAQAAANEVKQMAVKGCEVFSMVLEKLCALSTEAEACKQDGVSSLKAQLKREQASFKSKIEDIQLKLTSPTLDSCWSDCEQASSGGEEEADPERGTRDVSRHLWDIEDCLVQLKQTIAEAVVQWNSRLTDANKKKEAKSASKSLHANLENNEDMNADLCSRNVVAAEQPGMESSEPHPASMDSADNLEVPSVNSSSDTFQADLWASESTENKRNSSSLDVPEETADNESFRGHERSYSEGATSTVLDDVPVGTTQRTERRSMPQVPSTPTVKQIFSQLLSVSSTIIPSPLSSQEHHLLPASLGPAISVLEKEPSSIIAYTLCSSEYQRKMAEARQLAVFLDAPPPSPSEVKRKSQDPASGELLASADSTRRTVLSFLRGGGSPNLSANRHTPLAKTQPEYDGVQYSAATPGSQLSGDDEGAADNLISSEPRSRPSSKLGGVEASIEVSFNDSITNFHCRVYLPEQFEALRVLVCPEGEESYARSLAHCIQWAARGGKSGSAFLKTKDDRFVLKEMTSHERQLFLEIAPNYLSYIRRALETGQPTLLGKIVGMYHLSYRGVANTTAVKSNFLVMENLFYGRTITQRFDLKGSMRNRLVETTLSAQTAGDSVLLDENLLKMTCDAPLYIYPHSKMVLTQAIEKDTQFLASQAVMDYSLLVGLDEERRELVLGIIDYVRPFTWDKKLETMVKLSLGQGKLPTIVPPEIYLSRFMAAMHRYFLPVPDRWTGLGSGVDC